MNKIIFDKPIKIYLPSYSASKFNIDNELGCGCDIQSCYTHSYVIISDFFQGKYELPRWCSRI